MVTILKSISLFTFAAASALIQSQPAPGGCTASPFTVSSWFFQDFTANRAEHHEPHNRVNRATNYTLDIGRQA